MGELSRTGDISEISTLTGRTELWGYIWTKISERPLLGWGYNGTEAMISREWASDYAGSGVNAHNMILQSLLSVGFLGTLPVLALLGVLITRFVRRPDPIRDLIAIFVMVTGIGEVGFCATPVLLTLVVFWVAAREAAHPDGKQQELPGALPSLVPTAV